MREFIERAFAVVGRTIAWKGEGVEEIGVDTKTGTVLIEIDPRGLSDVPTGKQQGRAG